jgi:hypothetical protein
VGAGHGFATPGLIDHIGQREARQMLTHVIANIGPNAQQNALSFVIAGTVLVGLAEVARCDRSIDRRDDFGQGDGLRSSSQDVPAAHAALGANETGALQT